MHQFIRKLLETPVCRWVVLVNTWPRTSHSVECDGKSFSNESTSSVPSTRSGDTYCIIALLLPHTNSVPWASGGKQVNRDYVTTCRTLFTMRTGLTRSAMAWRRTVSVWMHTPSTESTTTRAPSDTRSAAVTFCSIKTRRGVHARPTKRKTRSSVEKRSERTKRASSDGHHDAASGDEWTKSELPAKRVADKPGPENSHPLSLSAQFFPYIRAHLFIHQNQSLDSLRKRGHFTSNRTTTKSTHEPINLMPSL